MSKCDPSWVQRPGGRESQGQWGKERQSLGRGKLESGYSHQHILPVDLHLVNSLLDLRAQWRLSRPHVKLPAMPGTGHRRPFQRSIDEWATLVRADPIDGRDLAIHVEESINSPLEFDFLGRPRREALRGSPFSRISTSNHLPLFPPCHPIPGAEQSAGNLHEPVQASSIYQTEHRGEIGWKERTGNADDSGSSRLHFLESEPDGS